LNRSKINVDHVTVKYKNGHDRPWSWLGRDGSSGLNGSRCGCVPDPVILQDITLEIDAGEFVCILGHSGCGKSTLLKVIAGFLKPDAGAVLIDGQEVKGPQNDHVFVFQEGALFPWLTIVENVDLALRSIQNASERREKANYYLELVALEGVEGHYPHMLSGGMRQRAEIARALAAQPDILMMDEPFSGLDYLTRLHMSEEMLNLHAMLPETTILFVTHDIDESLQMSNRLVVLSEAPAHIKCCRRIDLPRPRTTVCPTLSELRTQIYHHLGVHSAL
jgi:ABC-type nitrate/sulfonate/bicarbonate transport system ATPase subunit